MPERFEKAAFCASPFVGSYHLALCAGDLFLDFGKELGKDGVQTFYTYFFFRRFFVSPRPAVVVREVVRHGSRNCVVLNVPLTNLLQDSLKELLSESLVRLFVDTVGH